MVENIDNMVLEQLKLIREQMSDMRGSIVALGDKIETIDSKVDGLSVILVNFGANIHDLNERAGHIEEKLGVE